MILTIQRKDRPSGVVVLEMSGRIVLGSDSKNVEWKVDELLKENCKRIIFDLAGVTVLDSTGVGILVVCYARVKKAGGSLHVSGATGMVDHSLRMTNVDKLIDLDATVADAEAKLSQPAN